MASITLYPYGYKLSFMGKKEIHEERAAVVRMIYEKYIGGMNRYTIMLYLAEHGILRPRGDSTNWQYSMVSRILGDERYVGNERYPQILTREIFEAAQETRRQEWDRMQLKKHESCNNERVYPFTGFLKCGSCGKSYTRGIQRVHSTARKASWRCFANYQKGDDKCKSSGTIYEEMLELVCVEAYNKVQKMFLEEDVKTRNRKAHIKEDKHLEMLIEETIEQMTWADDKRQVELLNDLNELMNARTAKEWESAQMDLSGFETKKIKNHFAEYPMPMEALEIDRFKMIFKCIIADEPGKLKCVLLNGTEVLQEYIPMKGQVENAKKRVGYSGKADK